MESTNASGCKFGVYLPNVGWDTLPRPAQVIEYAILAEDLGLDKHPEGIMEAAECDPYGGEGGGQSN